jgi:hypothetical protein
MWRAIRNTLFIWLTWPAAAWIVFWAMQLRCPISISLGRADE